MASIHASPTPPSADAVKARIIKHLNNDHQRELAHYLQHYAHLSARAAHADPRLTDMTLTDMYISTRNTAPSSPYKIAIDPPMTSWSDARDRSVNMDKKARAALGIDEVQVTQYAAPRSPLHVFLFALCGSVYLSFIFRSALLQPGSFFRDVLLERYYPGGATWFAWMQKQAIAPMLAIHVAEVWWLIRTRLTKYDVQGAVWWKWVASCFVEGFGAFQRLDAIVAGERAKREKVKH